MLLSSWTLAVKIGHGIAIVPIPSALAMNLIITENGAPPILLPPPYVAPPISMLIFIAVFFYTRKRAAQNQAKTVKVK